MSLRLTRGLLLQVRKLLLSLFGLFDRGPLLVLLLLALLIPLFAAGGLGDVLRRYVDGYSAGLLVAHHGRADLALHRQDDWLRHG